MAAVARPTPMLLRRGMVAAAAGPYYGVCGGGLGDGNPDGGAGRGRYYQGQGGGAGGGGHGRDYYQRDGGGRGYYQGGGDGGCGRGCGYYQGGRKSLYTAGELPFNTKEFEVTLSDNKQGPSGQRRARKFKVTIKHATLVRLQQLQILMAVISTDIPAQALQSSSSLPNAEFITFLVADFSKWRPSSLVHLIRD